MLRYHLLAFLSGAIVLVLEIMGTRLFAPYLGTAFFVWVNVIGVILAALSLGYWLGGVFADRNQKMLPLIFLGGAGTVALMLLWRIFLTHFGALGIRLGSLLAALLLFAPPSLILGMVSPYLIKLAAYDLAHLGQTSGRIYAASTLGSIAGTFVTGFWLIPHFTITQIIWGMVATLFLLAFLGSPGPKLHFRGRSRLLFFLSPIIIAMAGYGGIFLSKSAKHIRFEKNSHYYNIRVHEIRRRDGKTQRTLLLDGSTQSARFVGQSGMPYAYVDLSAKLISALKPNPRAMLVIGGGAYSIPEYVKKASPTSEVVVVEIDPEVTRIAKQFFLEDPPNTDIQTINEDGRFFLNENKRCFDLIYTDAYAGAFAIPAHLATREAFLRMQQALTPDGLIIFNISSALEGKHSPLFRSFFKTLAGVFPETMILATRPKQPESLQNAVLLASRSKEFSLSRALLAPFEPFRYDGLPITEDVPELTDDFAPTDYLGESLVTAFYPQSRRYQE